MSYLEDYRKQIDERVTRDPRAAVGGRWKQIGEWQFNLLVRCGLRRDNKLLDVGCGTLRGGRHFIRYLNPGHYTGLDLSMRALDSAAQLVVSEGLTARQPRLILTKNGRLDFKEFSDETFDFILAQSVFTHLPPDLFSQCFEHLPNIMHSGSVFYFTYNEAPVSRRVKFNAWKYSWPFLQELCQLYGFMARREPLTGEQWHPRGLVTVGALLDCNYL